MSQIKVLKVDANGDYTEHNSAVDSIQANSFDTANYTLTDVKLGLLVNSVDASSLHNHDVQYFPRGNFIDTSTGAADAAKPVKTNAAGRVDASFIDLSTLQHGNLGGLAADDHLQYLRTDGTRALTGDMSMGSHKLTNLADGVSGSDAINLAQLNAKFSNFDWKPSVRAVSISNISLSGTQTVDGVALIAGDRVLVAGQTSGAQNGIYVVAAGAWARSSDAATSGNITSGLTVPIEEGSYTKTTWRCTTTGTIVVDTTSLNFEILPVNTFFGGRGVNLVANNRFEADLTASGGLQFIGSGDTAQISVKVADFVGQGVKDDGSNKVAIDFSTLYNDQKAIAAADLASIASGKGASLIGLQDLGNYTPAANVEAGIAELFSLAGAKSYTVGASAVAKGDLVYVSANDTIQKMPINAAHECVGMAIEAGSAGAQVRVKRIDYIASSVVTGATFDTKYYWSGSALTATMPSASGSYVWMVGSARNATDLSLNVHFIKRNA